jgi:hypothetical protein
VTTAGHRPLWRPKARQTARRTWKEAPKSTTAPPPVVPCSGGHAMDAGWHGDRDISAAGYLPGGVTGAVQRGTDRPTVGPPDRTAWHYGRARYWCTWWIHTEPSPTAEATRLTDPCRTSPTAKTPGTVVSNGRGARSSGQDAPASAPVRT